ncbi:MAG: hypothetical protein ABI634_11200 [Acidobacteriota bacterium]
MAEPADRPRASAFLIAAVVLPLLVVAVFLVASAVPRWTVAPPQYDLLLRADSSYSPARSQTFVNVVVRDGHVVADVQPLQPNTDPRQPALFLFDHRTLSVTAVRLELPSRLDDGEASRTIPIAQLAQRRVLDAASAPDGYAFDTRYQRGPGLVGDIFGMNRYGSRVAIAKGGRVVPMSIPEPDRYSIQPVGWLAAEGE